MRRTSALRRASQAVSASSTEASRIVDAAARRASEAALARRPRGMRKYADVIVVGLTAAVAATALKRRRDHEDYRSMAEARIERLEAERDEAKATVALIRVRLVEASGEGIAAVDQAAGWWPKNADKRTEALSQWLKATFDDHGESDDMLEQMKQMEQSNGESIVKPGAKKPALI